MSDTSTRRTPLALPSRRRLIAAGVAVAVLAIGLGVRNAVGEGVLAGLGTAVAVLLAAAVALLALSLPGISPEGLFIGIGLPFSAMMAWTHLDQPIVIWTVEAVMGVVLVVWTWRWWAEWRELPRLGTFWLAVPVWGLGFLAALFTGHLTVAVQRLVYGGFALLVLLILVQAWWRRRRDVSIGLVAGFLFCHALILLAGADNVFVTDHYVTTGSTWGRSMQDRFWGGPLLVWHPNFIAMTAVIAAMRIAPDVTFRAWQRWGALATAGFLLAITQSRTSTLIAIVASSTWLVLVIWRHPAVRRRLTLLVTTATYRRVLGKAVLPLVLTMLVLVLSGGSGFLFKDRYQADQPETSEEDEALVEESSSLSAASSGRIGLWKLIGEDWVSDSLVEKAAGNADNARGYILVYKWSSSDPIPEEAKRLLDRQPKHTADNTPVGALRRSGVLGVLASLAGLLLVLWRATRRGVPIWITITAFGVLATVITEDEVLNTAPGWAILVAGEVLVLAKQRRGDAIAVDPPPEDAPEQVAASRDRGRGPDRHR